MERIRFITCKGHKILYIDHTGLTEDEIVKNITTANKFMIECDDDELLMLINVTGLFTTEKVMAKLKSPDSVKALKKTKKSAVLGIVGVKRTLLNTYNYLLKQNIRAFKTTEEAQEYLVSE